MLGATTNWIVLRFVGAAVVCDDGGSKEKIGARTGRGVAQGVNDERGGLGGMEGLKGVNVSNGEDGVAVVLVSWMRDLEFWRVEGMKTVVSIL